MPNFIARLLGRGERKSSAVTSLTFVGNGARDAVWSERDYSTLAQEGYEQAVWVYACIREIVNAAKRAPLLAYRPSGDGVDEDPQHPALALLRRPSGFAGINGEPGVVTSGDQLLEALLGHLLLAGNAYLERVEGVGRAPVELHVLRPDRMQILTDPRVGVRGYRYKIGNVERDFLRGEVTHLRMWHPRSDYVGMSVIEAAARGVDTFNTGMAHNLALLQNGARHSGAWVTPGALQQNQFTRLRQQIEEQTRISNRGAPLVIEGGLDWRAMGMTPHELDWLKGLQDAARQIHAAFGVHPVLTGLQEGTYENQQQAMRGLYTRVVLPLLDYALEAISNWLMPAFGTPDAYLGYDRDGIDALSEDQDRLFTRLTSAYTAGVLTRNEAREALGYEAVEGGDAFAEATSGATSADEEEGGTEAGEERARRTSAAPAPLYTASTREGKDALAAAHRTLQERWEALYRSKVAHHLMAVREELRTTLPRASDVGDLEGRMVQVLMDREGALRSLMAAQNIAVATAFGEAVRASLSKRSAPAPAEARSVQDIFDWLYQEVLRQLAEDAARSVTQISSTIRRSLRRELHAGVQVGESIPDLAKRIDTLMLRQIIPNRSVVIARTEVIAASNYGSQKAAEATGLNLMHEWVTQLDGRERDAHANAHGQKRYLHEPFDVMGEQLMHPGDRNGSAGNVIQCRCAQVFVEVTA